MNEPFRSKNEDIVLYLFAFGFVIGFAGGFGFGAIL